MGNTPHIAALECREPKNFSATTGKPGKIGEHRGPIKNSFPNPQNWWWGAVLTEYGWSHFQEIGRPAVEGRMLECIAAERRKALARMELRKKRMAAMPQGVACANHQ